MINIRKLESELWESTDLLRSGSPLTSNQYCMPVLGLILSILTAFLTFLLGIVTALLYIVMVFCIFGAVVSFVQGEIRIGISGLVIGFLFSPYGLPMIGATVIAFIELINDRIKAV